MEKLFEKKFSKKEFLKIAGTGIALATLESLLVKVHAEDVMPELGTKKYAMVIDLRRCIGCESCTVACKVENNTPVDYSGKTGRKIFWNEVLFKEEKNYPFTKRNFWPRPCFHCEHPTCVKVCPTGASYKNEDGIVLVDHEVCIGCRYCAVACPYGARYFNWSKPHWPKEREGTFNPEVEMRYTGIVEKCTFCLHRINKVVEQADKERRDPKDEEFVHLPACAQTCMSKARYFGDLNDPESKVSKLVRSGRAYRLEEQLGNEPKVFYLKEA
ncbi:MAG: 4Fe-4S dicluster domain-containing protein [Elusimicrobia bacterium]|nr:4Fe-4S dicluster domain-containing protein [Elusimicrobiota bacterium]